MSNVLEVEQLRAAQDGKIARAMTLYQSSVSANDRTMRGVAQQQWRYAVRDLNEPSLLAAAAMAQKQGFNEMAIYAADRTNQLIDYNIRYMSPYRDITSRYAAQVGIDPAWAYGLIRQESRFMIGARSHVGASGLMQLMPATAREVERKIGSSVGLDDIEHNIKLGTWYLADVRNSSGSENHGHRRLQCRSRPRSPMACQYPIGRCDLLRKPFLSTKPVIM